MGGIELAISLSNMRMVSRLILNTDDVEDLRKRPGVYSLRPVQPYEMHGFQTFLSDYVTTKSAGVEEHSPQLD